MKLDLVLVQSQHGGYLSPPQHQSITCYSVPQGKHKLDPIMRGSNDCLCIFGLDFQLYIADIIVLDAVCWGIKLNFAVLTQCLIEHARETMFSGKVLLWPAIRGAYSNQESAQPQRVYKVLLQLLLLPSVRYWAHPVKCKSHTMRKQG